MSCNVEWKINDPRWALGLFRALDKYIKTFRTRIAFLTSRRSGVVAFKNHQYERVRISQTSLKVGAMSNEAEFCSFLCQCFLCCTKRFCVSFECIGWSLCVDYAVYKVVLAFEFVDEILLCQIKAAERYFLVALIIITLYKVAPTQSDSVDRANPKVWPFKWNSVL